MMSRKATARHSRTYGHRKETLCMLFMTKECLYWAARNKMMNLYFFWGIHWPQNKAWWRFQTMNLKGQARILKRCCRIWRPSRWKNQKYSIVHVEQYERQQNDILETHWEYVWWLHCMHSIKISWASNAIRHINIKIVLQTPGIIHFQYGYWEDTIP